MGGPTKDYKWGKDQGGVTIHDDKTGKDTIYINPSYAQKANPKDGAALLAHESWHVLSPYKNTLAQEKVGDDMRNSVDKELMKNYGDDWAKTKGFDSVAWPKEDGRVYKEDFHEYDHLPKARRPAVGDISAEGAVAARVGIPLDPDVVKQGDEIFTKEADGKRTDAVLK
jgi:hypothetical protein